jgi:molecular chaperone DnaJ
LGDHIEIPIVGGKVKMTIKQGTQPGKVLKLSGKGVPDINGYGRGDQLIIVNAWVPQQLTKEEKEYMEKLKNSSNFNPDPNNTDKSFFSKMRDFFA